MTKELKKTKSNKKIICAAAIVTAAAIVLGSTVALRPKKNEAVAEIKTAAVTKGTLNKIVSVSGTVYSDETTNIYSRLSAFPIKTVNVDVGDTVKKGDVLASLDVSDLEFDLRQAENGYKLAQNGSVNETDSIKNGITNAGNALETAKLSLERQQLSYDKAKEELDKYKNDTSESAVKEKKERELLISSAKLNTERRLKDIENAKKDVATAKKDLDKANADLHEALYDFDDYLFQNAITDAKNNLDRRKKDLEDAKKDLADFDDTALKQAVDQAQVTYNRLTSDKSNTAVMIDPATGQSIQVATGNSQAAERAVMDAGTALSNAKKNLEKARKDYDDKMTKAVEAQQNALNDAQDAYDRAKESLTRAQDDQIKAYRDKSEAMQKAYDGAVRVLENAQRAYQDALRAYDDAKDNTEKNFENEQKALQTAQLNVVSAQEALSQAVSRGTTSNSESQKISLEKLQKTFKDSVITASEDGIITEKNAKTGSYPQGVMFVVENPNNLYVSAKVKEYTVGDVSLGQKVRITTDATGSQIFDGEISYISPKAVSAAGSTNVEFEIKAAVKNPNDKIRIGMNAFLDILTAEKPDALYLPLSAVFEDETGYNVYVYENNAGVKTPVKTGIKTANYAEILPGSNLAENTPVIADPEEYRLELEKTSAKK